jgi:N-acetyl-anhydromuramyl-L-alanine amidase AmpD
VRHIDLIVIHCSATRASIDIGAADIREWHMSPPRNWKDIGYHYVIRRSGQIEAGRAEEEVGAHAKGNNMHSIGICLVGGLDDAGDVMEGHDTFTNEQWGSLKLLVQGLRHKYPGVDVQGHRDLSPDVNHDGVITPDEWVKACPCFNAAEVLV